ncbi:hypothetical protein GGR06_004081 [Bacteroides reticulotermitis]|uniref:Uncharacterized protein n=1 Tax=Bacteroides reticulotermitis TaxID=1133319 RepID=A0A840D702_9BACE|nr:hypothetical protein [Bacteroides reticulotermitis]
MLIVLVIYDFYSEDLWFILINSSYLYRFVCLKALVIIK